MKLDLITVAAVGVAGLALATWARRKNGTTPTFKGNPALSDDAVRQMFYMSDSQRRASGQAVPDNMTYLRYWDNPMASTIYSTGSLGD